MIFIDLLSRLMSRAKSVGLLHGVKIGKTCSSVSNLLYADDATFFRHATEDESCNLVEVINLFCEWSGQSANWGNSLVHFNKRVDVGVKERICDIQL